MGEIYRWLVICTLLVGAWSASTKVQILPHNVQGRGKGYTSYSDFLKNSNAKPYTINALDRLKDIGKEEPPKYQTLGDFGDIKKDLANGDVQKVLDKIPEFIERFPVKVRTVWQGEKTPDQDEAEFSVKNTVNVDAYQGDKSKLHLIMDSKFRQNGENIEVIDPSVQLQFQVKY